MEVGPLYQVALETQDQQMGVQKLQTWTSIK